MAHCIAQPVRAALAVAVLLGVGANPAFAGGHGHGGGAGGAGHGFHDHGGAGSVAPGTVHGWHGNGPVVHGAPHHFHNGHWIHGVRGGQFGWWWVAGGTAYLYAQPVYPYPDAYAPGAVIIDPGYRYYCNALQAYFPEVQSCPEPWLLVVPNPG